VPPAQGCLAVAARSAAPENWKQHPGHTLAGAGSSDRGETA